MTGWRAVLASVGARRMRRLPLPPLRRSLYWRGGSRTRFTIPEPLEEERLAAEAAREVSGRSPHAEPAGARPGSNFISFCREHNLGPRQGAPVKRGERWAAEAALEQRMGRKLDEKSWATRGWVMGVPPEPTSTPPSKAAGPAAGALRQRALADWVMGHDLAPSSGAPQPSQPPRPPPPHSPSSDSAAASGRRPKAPNASAASEPTAAGSVPAGVPARWRALSEFSLTPRQVRGRVGVGAGVGVGLGFGLGSLTLTLTLALSLAPRQMKAELDQLVIAQDEAKRALSVALCNHYRFVQRCLATPEHAGQAQGLGLASPHPSTQVRVRA